MILSSILQYPYHLEEVDYLAAIVNAVSSAKLGNIVNKFFQP